MVEPKDRFAQGDPETVVFLPGGDSLIGLYIRDLEDAQHVMLGIREDRDGQPVSCAVGNLLHIDPHPSQRNPNRVHGYGVVRDEEDGN